MGRSRASSLADPSGIRPRIVNMSQYDPTTVTRYFDEFGIAEFDRFDKSPVERLKLHLHMRCLSNYVPAGSHVLEIGAGPGRFTEALARLGCRVVVNDISSVQLQLNKERAEQNGYEGAIEQWLQADVCNLEAVRGERFDVVVAYGGVFSYVLDQRDLAMDQCLSVLEPTGRLISSVMALWGTAHAFLNVVLEGSAAQHRAVIRTGDLTPATALNDGHHLHMFRSAEFRAFLVAHDLKIEHFSASNAVSTGWSEYLTESGEDSEIWRSVIELEEAAAEEPGTWDLGTHIIAVGSRKSATG